MVLNPILEQKLNKLHDSNLLDKDLAKIILFAIDNDIDLEKYISKEWYSTYKKLIINGFIERDYHSTGNVKLTKSLYDLPEKSNSGKISYKEVEFFISEKIDEYRNIFSKNEKGTIGLRPGSMGDKKDTIRKLVKWFKKTNFEYTWNDVLKTARMYVESCREDNYRFLQAADYFIYKDNRSRLSSLIDEGKHYDKESSDIKSFNEFI